LLLLFGSNANVRSPSSSSPTPNADADVDAEADPDPDPASSSSARTSSTHDDAFSSPFARARVDVETDARRRLPPTAGATPRPCARRVVIIVVIIVVVIASQSSVRTHRIAWDRNASSTVMY